MRRLSQRLNRHLAFLACLAATSFAVAAPLSVHAIEDDPERLVIGPIEASFAHFAEAASGFFLDAYANRRVTESQFETFAHRFNTGTFAEARYIYTTADGVSHTRYYHASSGDVGRDPPIPGGARRYPFFSYLDPNAPEIVARWDPVDGSDVTHRPVDDGRGPDAHRNDAEIKAAQTLEHDLVEGVVPRGGRLVVFVSQRPCTSCDPALRAFSDRYDVPVVVNFLERGSRAYRIFDRQRRNYMLTVWRIAFARMRMHMDAPLPAATPAPPAGEPTPSPGPGTPFDRVPAQCPAGSGPSTSGTSRQ